MNNPNYYQELGLMKKWEVQRLSSQRGWEIVGTNDKDEGFVMFLPDKAVDALLSEVKKLKRSRTNANSS